MKKTRRKKGSRDPEVTALEGVAKSSESKKSEHISDAPRHRQKHRIMIWILLGVASLLVLAGMTWLCGNLFFSSFKIGSVRVATHVSDAVLEQTITQQANAYRLRIVYPDNTVKVFSAKSVGAQADPGKTITRMRQQQKQFKNRLEWWHPLSVMVTNHLNAAALTSFIANNTTFTTKPPQNATITITNGTVQLTDASMGAQYNLPDASGVITNAVENLQTTPLHLRATVVLPAITASMLTASKAQLDATLKQHITITVGDQTITPSPGDIADWLTITPNTTSKTVDIAVNSDNVQAYMNSLASAHTLSAQSQISSAGAILTAGSPGVTITGTAAATSLVAQNLLKGQGLPLNLPAQYIPFSKITAPTNGKWIEINITTKRMYTYDQGAAVRTFLISAGAYRTPTVTGQFAIYSKYASQNMTGANVDGSSYYQPNVPWVNYFYRDYAIHGNYWRPASYFGNINSSHGCVGTLVSDAAWIYTWAPIGTPVIVHT